MGRKFYIEIQPASETEILSFLKKKTIEAVKIESVEDTNNLEKLVFLQDIKKSIDFLKPERTKTDDQEHL